MLGLKLNHVSKMGHRSCKNVNHMYPSWSVCLWLPSLIPYVFYRDCIAIDINISLDALPPENMLLALNTPIDVFCIDKHVKCPWSVQKMLIKGYTEYYFWSAVLVHTILWLFFYYFLHNHRIPDANWSIPWHLSLNSFAEISLHCFKKINAVPMHSTDRFNI